MGEVVGIEKNDAPFVYLISLHGSSTLYYEANESTRTEYTKNMKKWPSLYSLPVMNDIELNSTTSPKFGYGSVHKAGKNNGTIHSNPKPDPKFVIGILPDKLSTITMMINRQAEYQRAAKSSLNSKCGCKN